MYVFWYTLRSLWYTMRVLQPHYLTLSGIILWMRPANERRRYIVTSSLISWAHTQNGPCIIAGIIMWH